MSDHYNFNIAQISITGIANYFLSLVMYKDCLLRLVFRSKKTVNSTDLDDFGESTGVYVRPIN
jgi:hypothetical protein